MHQSRIWPPTVTLLVCASCLVEDPNHCANWEEKRCGPAMICSLCTARNGGCIDEERDPDCIHAHASTGSVPDTGTRTSTSTTSSPGSSIGGSAIDSTQPSYDADTTDSGSPMASNADSTEAQSNPGEMESSTGMSSECRSGRGSACPYLSPYCMDGTCASCDVQPDKLCTLDETCHADWGRCVPCLIDSDCAQGEHCDDNYRCSATCLSHDHCPSSACDFETGTCFGEDTVVHVAECEVSGGPQYCSIASALLDNAGQNPIVVRVARTASASSYPEAIDFVARTVAIVGEAGTTLAGVSTQDAPIVRASNNAHLSISRIRLRTAPSGVVVSDGSRLYLDQVRIDGMRDVAISATSRSRVKIRETEVVLNAGDAIYVSDSELSAVASIVGCNGRAGSSARALRVNQSQVDLLATTIAGNGAPDAGVQAPVSIECDPSSIAVLRNAIVLSEQGDSVGCPALIGEQSVVDTVALWDTVSAVVGPGQPWTPAWFVAVDPTCDLHLAEEGRESFGGVATWEFGDPRRDIDGADALPFPGAPTYVGADQP